MLVNIVGQFHGNDACSYINSKKDNAIFIVLPTTDSETISADSEITSAFRSHNNNSSCDADGIQVRPMKHLLDLFLFVKPVYVEHYWD